MFAIPTGSRLSELSNIISTKAEMTRGPVPSYNDRREKNTFNTIVKCLHVLIALHVEMCFNLEFNILTNAMIPVKTFVICQLLGSDTSFSQRKHAQQEISTQPLRQRTTFKTVAGLCTYMEQGQALFGSQVTKLITEHKLDG